MPQITNYVSPTECLFLIQNAKEEDMGHKGLDLTSQTFIEADRQGKATFRARKEGKLAGAALLQWIARIYDPSLEVEEHMADGDNLTTGCDIATVTGPLQSILSFERVALNFMTHLSGIASMTWQFVQLTQGTKAGIFDTRKTIPGLRSLAKYAVVCGGGQNHRIGLFDAILIKDNHIAHIPLEQLGEALKVSFAAARQSENPPKFIEVEGPYLDNLLTRFPPNILRGMKVVLDLANGATQSTTLPLPLENSPKCHGCSLSGICLPDETLTSAALDRPLVIADADVDTDVDDADAPGESTIRRLYPARDEAQPLYVQKQGAFIGKTSQSLVVRKEKQKLNTVKLKDLNQVVICGNIGISAQAIHTLCEAGIPIVHLSMGHWFYGITHGINLRNAFDRAAQFQAAQNEILKLQFARYLVISKAINQRTMLRRNASNVSTLDRTLTDMQELIDRLPHVTDIPGMLGHEGMIAAHYFRHFDKMLKPQDFDATWDFSGRNRRPPKDPVNALLSFGYAFLTKEFTVALLAEGLDPWWGLYHKPRHGRPALALDLMEPFRPVVVDSAVITAINTGMTRGSHFTRSKSGCVLKPDGRKNFIRAYENRLSQLVTHPLFGYRCSWRSMIKLQARLFSRWLRKDIPHLPEVITR